MTRASQIVRVVDTSEVAGARRVAIQCAEALRLTETEVGKAALVTTELATNLVKHGNGGSILFGSDRGEAALVIIAIDKGRGIPNMAAAMRDGYSTAGSPGTGLGAIRRAASTIDLYSVPDKGTVVLCRIGAEEKRPVHDKPRFLLGGVCLAKPGEDIPGDDWTAASTRDSLTISVADGLGHGPIAATASAAAVRIFSAGAETPLERLLEDAHAELRATRGAAVGIARIHAAQNRVDFAGVGNIAGAIATHDVTRRLVSLNGIVGHEMRKVQTFSYPWTPDSVLILQSDGTSANWNGANYPGLMQHEPLLIAAVLYRDYCRGTDDATVVVAKAS